MTQARASPHLGGVNGTPQEATYLRSYDDPPLRWDDGGSAMIIENCTRGIDAMAREEAVDLTSRARP